MTSDLQILDLQIFPHFFTSSHTSPSLQTTSQLNNVVNVDLSVETQLTFPIPTVFKYDRVRACVTIRSGKPVKGVLYLFDNGQVVYVGEVRVSGEARVELELRFTKPGLHVLLAAFDTGREVVNSRNVYVLAIPLTWFEFQSVVNVAIFLSLIVIALSIDKIEKFILQQFAGK